MATITGLTAERMLAIEGASVIDGDIVGDNLILTQRNGTQINAGDVRGPQGNPGPVGQDLVVVTSAPVLDVGIAGQIRAGRQLTAADFTNMGLAAPVGLWNLSDLTDASGNGRNLLNKGAVPLGIGINGLANTAARFKGADQGLYISDTGAADPFRIKTGSYGAWFKSARRGLAQNIMGKVAPGASYFLQLGANNLINVGISVDGSSYVSVQGLVDVCNDRWHFCVCTYDGLTIRVYTDGFLDAAFAGPGGIIAGTAAPFNIGTLAADAATSASNPTWGPVDEAFVMGEVLTAEQVYALYCARMTHTLAAVPSRVSISVQRRRIGTALAVADFPIQPARLHNFSNGSVGDEGSNGVPLSNATGCTPTAGVDGTPSNAFSLNGNCFLESSDAGMPQLLVPRSYGAWFKTTAGTAYQTLVSWGIGLVRLGPQGYLEAWSGAAGLTSAIRNLNDGTWHHFVNVEDPNAVDGVKQKLYIDGRLDCSAITMSTTAALAGKFSIGCDGANGLRLVGQIDTAFVIAAALTAEEIIKIYRKSSPMLGSSPKNPGDHVETMSNTDLLVSFATLPPQSRVDVRVAA